MKIRRIAVIFMLFLIFSPNLFAGPIPSGQTSGAQASRFMSESQKKSMKYNKQNFDKKKKAGAYIEFKEGSPVSSKPTDKDLKIDAKD